MGQAIKLYHYNNGLVKIVNHTWGISLLLLNYELVHYAQLKHYWPPISFVKYADELCNLHCKSSSDILEYVCYFDIYFFSDVCDLFSLI